MEAVYIPTEGDIKKWVKEAVKDCLGEMGKPSEVNKEEPLLGRKEIAAFLKISLVTLNRWTKLGLPCHRLDRKVYFIKTEVMDYLKKSRLKKMLPGSSLFG